MTKEEILELFRGLKSKRLFSSDLDRIIAPAKGVKVSMNLSFVSARPALGRQIDSLYNNGYKAECSIDGEELEFIVLFRKEDSDFVENLGPGEDFEIPVQVLTYDALYQKPTLGALLKSNSDPKKPSKVTPEVQSSSENDIDILSEDVLQAGIETALGVGLEGGLEGGVEGDPDVDSENSSVSTPLPTAFRKSDELQGFRSSEDQSLRSNQSTRRSLNFKTNKKTKGKSRSSIQIAKDKKKKKVFVVISWVAMILGGYLTADKKSPQRDVGGKHRGLSVNKDGSFSVREGVSKFSGKTERLSNGSLIKYYVNHENKARIVSIQVARSGSLLKIPSKLGGDSVIGIRDRALRFGGRSIAIELPEGLREIGEYAFFRSRFKKIIIPSTVSTIGKNALGGDLIQEIVMKAPLTSFGEGKIGGVGTTLFYDPEQKGSTQSEVIRIRQLVHNLRTINGSLANESPSPIINVSIDKIDRSSKELINSAALLITNGQYARAHRILSSALNKLEDPKGLDTKSLKAGYLNQAVGLCYESVNDWMAAYQYFTFANNHFDKLSSSSYAAIKSKINNLLTRLETIGLVVDGKVIDPENVSTKNQLIQIAKDFSLFENRGGNEDKIYLPDEVEGYSGWVKVLYPDGNTKELSHYIRGWKDGLAYFWYEDGTLNQRRNFYKGNQFGLHQEWSTGGDLIEDKLYSKGQAQN